MKLVGRAVAIVLALAGTLVALLWWLAKPPTRDAFYGFVADPATAAGRLLRSEPFMRGLPAHARAWRILYTTTRSEEQAALASAIVVASDRRSADPRPVIAWAHGTIGVVPGCAPSLQAEPFQNAPALPQAMANDWVYVATDYAGLGTDGPHPYLIGEGQARSVLDAVRAARQLNGLALEDRTIVWGHSQGGHAALWTGILAPRYAPDVKVSAVAALAPATDLPDLLAAARETAIGKILAAYLATAYSAAYPDVAFDRTIRDGARWLARDMAARCLADEKALFSALEANLLAGSILSGAPHEGPLGTRLRENIPAGLIDVPLLVIQGAADELVLPDTQRRFMARRCAAGQQLEYRSYPQQDHLAVVAAGSPSVGDLVRWTQDRLDGKPPARQCPNP
jgi:pimeloyl-ACP methyl ester carboxylesterase